MSRTPTKHKPAAKATQTQKRASAQKKTPPKKVPAKKAAAKKAPRVKEERWQLRLYIAGQTPKSMAALTNLERICEEHLKGRYRIEVVDLMLNPALARGHQILAVPTLVRQLPPPVKKIIGDFTNSERVLVGLDIRPLKTSTKVT